MGLAPEFLGSVALVAKRSAASLTLPRPMPGNPTGFATVATFAEWRAFVLRVGQGLQDEPLRIGEPAALDVQLHPAQHRLDGEPGGRGYPPPGLGGRGGVPPRPLA